MFAWLILHICSCMPVLRCTIYSLATGSMTNGVDHCSSLMKTLNSVKDINFDPELESKEAMDREFHESVSNCKCSCVWIYRFQ